MNARRQFAEHICRVAARPRAIRPIFVGGCVRDILLGREPVDYDVATDATPERVAGAFPAQPGRRREVRCRRRHRSGASETPQVEVATFRSDVGYSDGRHPDRVVYASLAAGRCQAPRLHHQRPAARSRYERSSRLRGRTRRSARRNHSRHRPSRRPLPRRQAAHDSRRALRRAISATRSKPATFRAIQTLAPEIFQVSAERIRDELTKMLTEGAARRGFELLDETKLAARNCCRKSRA